MWFVWLFRKWFCNRITVPFRGNRESGSKLDYEVGWVRVCGSIQITANNTSTWPCRRSGTLDKDGFAYCSLNRTVLELQDYVYDIKDEC